MAAITLTIAAAVSFLLVALIRRWGSRLLDIPGERSSHTRPTPRGGGAAIVLVVIAGTALISLSKPFAAYLVAGLLIAIVSFIDDVRSLGWPIRFLTHAIGAVLLIAAAGSLQFPLPNAVAVVITFLWIAGLVNAYNFMDGIDGIAAGQAIVASVGWYFIFADGPLAMIALLVCGATIGFLIHNAPPARIFMGDVGSAFLGFTFAAFPVMATVNRERIAVAAPLLVFPFLADSIFTFFRRLRRGEHVFTAHRSHLYQRLVISGMTHGSVSLIYSGIAAISAAAAVAHVRGATALAGALAAAAVLCMAGVYVAVQRRESSPAARMPDTASRHPSS